MYLVCVFIIKWLLIMKTLESKVFKLVGALFLFLTMTVAVNAQKLPDIQKNGLRAPANINIDGKTTEWNDTFQAFNKNIDVFYTISNDDDNLYLAIQAMNIKTIYKIFNGGITFTINRSNAKNEDDVVAVKYPLRNNLVVFVLEDKPIVTKDSTINSKHVSSFINTLNAKFINKLQEIEVLQMKGVKDTISIYNEEGIKVSFLFNYNMAYNYELAIPLKYLNLAMDKPQKILYNIKVNGILSIMSPNAKYEIFGGLEADNLYALEDTDFSGEYTLVKE